MTTINTNYPLETLAATVERTVKDMGSLQLNLLHAALGLGGEAGEFQDLVKKITIYHSRDLNDEQVAQSLAYELGDILWYVQLAADVLGVPMEEIIAMNARKLTLRYPEKFTVQGTDEKADKVITGEIE